MMTTRYVTAADQATGRRTLELACASGPGLGLISQSATYLVGADINAAMLQRARRHYGERIPLVQLSAEGLPFKAGAFDFVLLLEASYYVPDLERALDEMDRVLSDTGRIMFVNANPEREDFIKSPYSHVYHSADQLRARLTARGFRVEVFGAFPIEVAGQNGASLKSTILKTARRTLETLRLVPRTLEGRARLKRLLGQKLRYVPGEIGAGFGTAHRLTAVGPGLLRGYKVFYMIANRDRSVPRSVVRAS